MAEEYEIALQFEDGITQFIKVAEGELLSDAAYRQKINIPLDCRDGACGTCRAYCESGSYEMDEDGYIEEALTEEEAANRYILACQCQPTSTGIYQIQSTSKVCKISIKNYEAIVSSLEKVSDSTFVLQLTLEESSEKIPFLSGQYVNLGIPETEEVRSYSFSSEPGALTLEFIIRNIPSGSMSQFLLNDVKVGDKMNFTGPYGSFYLRNLDKNTLFFAGGTGIAPFKSMLSTLVTQRNKTPVKLVYGVTNEVDLIGMDYLNEIAKKHDWFEFRTVVVNSNSSEVRQGYVTDHVDKSWLEQGDFDLYLCGPMAMVDAVQLWLKQEEIVPSNFYYERFTPNVTGE